LKITLPAIPPGVTSPSTSLQCNAKRYEMKQ